MYVLKIKRKSAIVIYDGLKLELSKLLKIAKNRKLFYNQKLIKQFHFISMIRKINIQAPLVPYKFTMYNKKKFFEESYLFLKNV